MTEFHFEDPDLKNSTLEKGFPSCAIEKKQLHGLSREANWNGKQGVFSSRISETKGTFALLLQFLS